MCVSYHSKCPLFDQPQLQKHCTPRNTIIGLLAGVLYKQCTIIVLIHRQACAHDFKLLHMHNAIFSHGHLM